MYMYLLYMYLYDNSDLFSYENREGWMNINEFMKVSIHKNKNVYNALKQHHTCMSVSLTIVYIKSCVNFFKINNSKLS